ncbi:MAG: DUF4126 domain-containing protein [Bacillota bacterium]|nr:DUF4126 domain-containing protein [Bacillota bacterium]
MADWATAVGIGVGLAGIAGLRGSFALLAVGLLGRYTELVQLRSSFLWLASTAGISLFLLLAVLESLDGRLAGVSLLGDALPGPLRLVAGGLTLAAFRWPLPPLLAFLAGLVAAGAGRLLARRCSDVNAAALVLTVLVLVFPSLPLLAALACLGMALWAMARAGLP